MLEHLAPNFLYSILKGGVSTLRHRKRQLSLSQVVELRHKWRPLFEARMWENCCANRASEVIIRDMTRIDNYPEAKETKGMSPWFRADLAGTYPKTFPRGVLVGLQCGTLTRHNGGERWRFTNRSVGEKGDIKVLMIGSIRYEDIDSVEWVGDEYYCIPHVYCFFIHKKEPYEHVGFYAKNALPDRLPLYTEIAPYDQVCRFSMKPGIRYFA